MVAYIVFTRERTRNQAELDTYSEKVPASMPGARPHAACILWPSGSA